jgi:hypothetical protein
MAGQFERREVGESGGAHASSWCVTKYPDYTFIVVANPQGSRVGPVSAHKVTLFRPPLTEK